MRSRGMVGVTAFVLATVATLAMFLYLHGVKHSAETGGAQATVVVSKKDLPAGTSMDAVISQGDLTTATIPAKDEVAGAVTSAEQLKGRVTNTPILAGEQIPVARLQGSTSLPGGTIGIPAGYEGVTLQLEAQRMVGGQIHASDHVAIYGSFAPPVSPTVTVTLVPDVKVLRVSKPSTVDQAANQGTMLLTVALRPQDAEKVLFGQEHGSVWMALLAPGQAGQQRPPVYAQGVLR
jgi:pilus assembly protein CpaB